MTKVAMKEFAKFYKEDQPKYAAIAAGGAEYIRDRLYHAIRRFPIYDPANVRWSTIYVGHDANGSPTEEWP